MTYTRAQAVRGLRLLAAFLEQDPECALLHASSALYASYFVLEDDREEARAEYEMLRTRLSSLQGYYGTEFTETACDDRDNSTVQHCAELAFADGAVRYQVLWIEKGAEVTNGA